MDIYTLFIQHIIYSMADKGKAAIVVPTGFITSIEGIPTKSLKSLIDSKILQGVLVCLEIYLVNKIMVSVF